MSTEPIITLILPIFNVEKYINRCFNSLYNQNIPESNFEIIAVNDCSPDNSKDCIQQFQSSHSNITLVDHEVNKGLGAARNTGLKSARGKYVWFIDTDDFVEANCLAKILEIVESNTLDVLSFNFFTQNDELKYRSDSVNLSSESMVMDGKTYLKSHYQPSIFSSWSKIYRKDYLIDNAFYFAEGVYWEDADLVVKSIYHASKVKFIPDYLYYYCYNDQSISRTESGKKYADMVKMGARKLAFSKSIEGESPDLAFRIKQDAIWNATTVKKIMFLSAAERSVFYRLLNESQYCDIKSETESQYLRFLYQYQVIVSFILFFLSPLLKRIKDFRSWYL